MGVGISAHRLAGSVAAEGAVGMISAIDLRRAHPDLMARSTVHRVGPQAKADVDAPKLEALQREIAAARELSQGRGWLAVNVMRAVGECAPLVRTVLESGIDAVVVAAGLPFGERIATVRALIERLSAPGSVLSERASGTGRNHLSTAMPPTAERCTACRRTAPSC